MEQQHISYDIFMQHKRFNICKSDNILKSFCPKTIRITAGPSINERLLIKKGSIRTKYGVWVTQWPHQA